MRDDERVSLITLSHPGRLDGPLRQLRINGVFVVADDCSWAEALLRAAIRFKQMAQGEATLEADWYGDIELEEATA